MRLFSRPPECLLSSQQMSLTPVDVPIPARNHQLDDDDGLRIVCTRSSDFCEKRPSPGFRIALALDSHNAIPHDVYAVLLLESSMPPAAFCSRWCTEARAPNPVHAIFPWCRLGQITLLSLVPKHYTIIIESEKKKKERPKQKRYIQCQCIA